MTAPLVIVTGTGTGIGKTVVARSLVAAWGRRGLSVAGVKPIESGVPLGSASPSPALSSSNHAAIPATDVASLGQVSTFHVTRFTSPYLLAPPVSPHLAARLEGREIDLTLVRDWVAPIRSAADAVVLELPGGLYTPLSDTTTNASLLLTLSPTKVLLVAPDRLGVLHDTLSTARAARADGIDLSGIILSAPVEADASTGTNAAELARVLPTLPVLATLPRAPLGSLNAHLDRVLNQLGI